MTYDNVTALICSVGFPIVACGFMGWYIVTIQKESISIMQEILKTLKGITTILDMEEDDD